jgi:hypothetical protein
MILRLLRTTRVLLGFEKVTIKPIQYYPVWIGCKKRYRLSVNNSSKNTAD